MSYISECSFEMTEGAAETPGSGVDMKRHLGAHRLSTQTDVNSYQLSSIRYSLFNVIDGTHLETVVGVVDTAFGKCRVLKLDLVPQLVLEQGSHLTPAPIITYSLERLYKANGGKVATGPPRCDWIAPTEDEIDFKMVYWGFLVSHREPPCVDYTAID
ncbi:hypothetical protein ACJJTC_018892 [Scirpophaga incertulas]